MQTKKFLTLAIALVVSVSAVAKQSNEQFASEVKRYRAQFDKDQSSVNAAKNLCQNLSQERWMNEPKCIALQRHISSTATRSKGGVSRF